MRHPLPILLALALAHLALADPAVEITGRFRSVNGTTEIPVGMFGVHATPLTPERIQDWGIESVRLIHHGPSGQPLVPGQARQAPEGISMIVECFYDRYQPALLLSDPERWEERLTDLARRYAENARDTGHVHHVEFWNEPFLNWATRPGVNYDPRHFETDEAEEGRPMRIRGQAEPVEHLVWSRQVRTVDAGSGATSPQAYLAHSHMGHRLPEGEAFEFRGRRYRNVEMWWGRDPTQKHYWSGMQNSIWYRRMLVPFAREMKRVNPEVRIAAGWDFHIQSHNWEAWHMLVRPMIDDAIEWIDGVTEHHYGGDTRMVAGAYETVYAYTLGTHGKRLTFYNTEAGGMLDPEQPGNPRTRAEGDPLAAARGGMTYTLRDILHLLDLMPDKAVARAAHEAHSWGGGGDEFAFRMLRHLRGHLLEVRSPWPQVWAVASLREDGRLNVVVFNDANSPREVPLSVAAPAGLRFRGGARQWVDAEDGRLVVREAPVEASGEAWSGTLDLPGKSAMSLILGTEGQSATTAMVSETQYASGQVVNWLDPGDSVDLDIELPPETLARAESAGLRLVFGWSAANARVEVNGTEIPFADRQSWVNQRAVPLDLLREQNRIRVTCLPEASAGIHLNAASIVLLSEEGP